MPIAGGVQNSWDDANQFYNASDAPGADLNSPEWQAAVMKANPGASYNNGMFTPAPAPAMGWGQPVTATADGPLVASDPKDPGAGTPSVFDYTGGSLLTPWTQQLPNTPGVSRSLRFGQFRPPSQQDMMSDPGFAFGLNQGLDTIQNRASAQGIRGGDVAKGMDQFATDYASTKYGDVYNRALQSYGANWQTATGQYDRNNQNKIDEYNRQMQQYGTAYDVFNNNQNNQYSRLMGQIGVGQHAADVQAQLAGAYGQNSANLITGAGSATAAGQIGSGNAWSNAISGIGNDVGMGLVLNSRMFQGPASNTGYRPLPSYNPNTTPNMSVFGMGNSVNPTYGMFPPGGGMYPGYGAPSVGDAFYQNRGNG